MLVCSIPWRMFMALHLVHRVGRRAMLLVRRIAGRVLVGLVAPLRCVVSASAEQQAGSEKSEK
jgi:hypothetical protein